LAGLLTWLDCSFGWIGDLTVQVFNMLNGVDLYKDSGPAIGVWQHPPLSWQHPHLLHSFTIVRRIHSVCFGVIMVAIQSVFLLLFFVILCCRFRRCGGVLFEFRAVFCDFNVGDLGVTIFTLTELYQRLSELYQL
jgi:hypothetical protein